GDRRRTMMPRSAASAARGFAAAEQADEGRHKGRPADKWNIPARASRVTDLALVLFVLSPWGRKRPHTPGGQSRPKICSSLLGSGRLHLLFCFQLVVLDLVLRGPSFYLMHPRALGYLAASAGLLHLAASLKPGRAARVGIAVAIGVAV